MPVQPNPSVDALSAWSPAREQGGNGFVLSHGLPDIQKTRSFSQVELIDAFEGGYTIKDEENNSSNKRN